MATDKKKGILHDVNSMRYVDKEKPHKNVKNTAKTKKTGMRVVPVGRFISFFCCSYFLFKAMASSLCFNCCGGKYPGMIIPLSKTSAGVPETPDDNPAL